MRISILCTSVLHPIMPYLESWRAEQVRFGYQIDILSQSNQLASGDILFLVSCSEKITQEVLKRFKHILVLHASDLPKGRGWNPYIWDILSGQEEIILCLIEAEIQIDTGKIWKKLNVPVPCHYLWDEINNALFLGEISLMTWAVQNYETVIPIEQDSNVRPTYWSRRTTQDSRLDADKTLADQFNLLRVCDPNRYPAFVELDGRKYKLILERLNDETN